MILSPIKLSKLLEYKNKKFQISRPRAPCGVPGPRVISLPPPSPSADLDLSVRIKTRIRTEAT